MARAMGDFPTTLFAWIERTPVALWVRESLWGFPFSLILHAWSMALLVGISVVLASSALGLAPRVLLPLAEKSKPVIWAAFLVSLISGLLLLSAYPAKALTNEVFYLKLAFIGVAMTLALSLVNQCRHLAAQHVDSAPLDRGPRIAWPTKVKLRGIGILLAWFGVIAAGRLLAYTYSILTVT
jgi:hypothetical protein